MSKTYQDLIERKILRKSKGANISPSLFLPLSLSEMEEKCINITWDGLETDKSPTVRKILTKRIPLRFNRITKIATPSRSGKKKPLQLTIGFGTVHLDSAAYLTGFRMCDGIAVPNPGCVGLFSGQDSIWGGQPHNGPRVIFISWNVTHQPNFTLTI